MIETGEIVSHKHCCFTWVIKSEDQNVEGMSIHQSWISIYRDAIEIQVLRTVLRQMICMWRQRIMHLMACVVVLIEVRNNKNATLNTIMTKYMYMETLTR